MSTEDTPREGTGPVSLAAHEILGTVGLGRFEQTLGSTQETQWSDLGRITFGRPTVLPLAPDRLPGWVRTAPDAPDWRYARLMFSFELHDQGTRRTYTDATLQVRLDCEAATALVLQSPRPAGPGGLMPRTPPWDGTQDDDPGSPPWVDTRTGGLGGSTFYWTLTDPMNCSLAATTYRVGAVLQLPSELTVLRGELRARARIRRSFLGALALERVVTEDCRPFRTSLSLVRSRSGARTRSDEAAPSAAVQQVPTVRRLCLAVDVESYSSRDAQGQCHVQTGLMTVLDRAATAAGLLREEWDRQGQGDGELAVLPPGLDEPRAIDEFLDTLRVALAKHNRYLLPEARLRLRLAFAEGPVQSAANGYAGDVVIAVSRMCDSEPLRAALRDHPGTNLVVGMSDAVHHGLAGAGVRHLRVDAFRRAVASVKEFRDDIWILAMLE